MHKRSNRYLQLAGLGVCAAIGALVYLRGTPVTTSPQQLVSMEQAILNAARHKPGDPDLGVLFEALNARHFSGRLPDVKVIWESDLDGLDVDDYRLNGLTDGQVILLKAALQDDDANLRRTLCHEMVHVAFIAAGNRSTTHRTRFQTELRRIFDDGCFHAIRASPEEKASLEQWIESERTRLDGAGLQVDARCAAVKLEADRIERTFSELNERMARANAAGSGWPGRDEIETAERQRTDSNDGIVACNAAVTDLERDQARFNEVVERYNLMMVYPDGLAEDRAKGLTR